MNVAYVEKMDGKQLRFCHPSLDDREDYINTIFLPLHIFNFPF